MERKDSCLIPSESTCTYCLCASSCPMLKTLADKRMADMAKGFLLEDTPADDLAERYRELPKLEKYIQAVRDKALTQALAGKKLNGLKLGQGRAGNRRWIDETLVRKYLRMIGLSESEIIEIKMKSPVNIQNTLIAIGIGKEQAKQAVDALTERKQGKPILVPEKQEGISRKFERFPSIKWIGTMNRF